MPNPIDEAERLQVLMLDPREVYDAALIGVTTRPDDHWERQTDTPCAVYSKAKCLELMSEADNMGMQEAMEFFCFNIENAWLGEGTPTFVEDLFEDEFEE